MAQWEWAIMLVGLVGVLVAELLSVRRSIRRERDKTRAERDGR